MTEFSRLEACFYAAHSLRRTKATLIYKKTGNLRAARPIIVSQWPNSLAYCRVVRWLAGTVPRKEIRTRRFTSVREIVVDRLAGLLRDLEANRPSRFALSNGGSIDGIAIGRHIDYL